MRCGLAIAGAFVLLLALSQSAFSQTNVVTNGSFESGLTGWTTSTQLDPGAAGTCSYNGVVAPGTETLTGLAGFSATDGARTALGSVADTSGTSNVITCVLYQDVVIPAGATTASITVDVGTKGNVNGANTAARIGIYSTGSIPAWYSTILVGSSPIYSVGVPDTILHSQSTGTFNISSQAGQTVRLAIMNAAQSSHGEVLGVDNVRLTVTAPASVPTLTEWGQISFLVLLGLTSVYFLRRRRLESGRTI
jgi:hypothetical protein